MMEREKGREGGDYVPFSSTQKLTYKLHPDALLQIVNCLVALIRNGHVLEKVGYGKQVRTDLKQLFEK